MAGLKAFIYISVFAVATACQSTPPPDPDRYNPDYSRKPQADVLQCMQVAVQAPQVTGGDAEGKYAEMHSYWSDVLAEIVSDEGEHQRLSAKYAPKLTDERREVLFESQDFIMALGLIRSRCDSARAEREAANG